MTATARALSRFLAGTVAGAIAPLCVGAATLGDIEVLSRPGEPLVATIAIDAAGGERIEPSCVFLSRGSPDTGPYVTGAKVGFETRGTRLHLHVRSNEAVGNPAARLRVVLRCPGETTFAYREYSALFAALPPLAPVAPALVPAPTASAQTAPAAAPTAPATPLARGGFPVQPGDSLDSIAGLIFPRQQDARRLYVEALREANPSLGSIAPREPLPAGTTLALPDLRTFAQGRALTPREPAVAAAPAAPAATPRAPRKPQLAEAPPKPAPAQRATPPAERPKVAAAKPAPEAPAPVAPAKSTTPRPRLAESPPGPAFVLKLSSSPVDLSRSRTIDDAERARMRERQRVLDSDDQVAAFLALRDSVQRLEGRVAELQLKLSTLSATQARAAAVETAPPKVAAKVEPTPPPSKPEPAKVEAPKVEPPKAEPPKPEPPKVEAPKVEPAKVEPPKVEARPPEPPAPKVETPAPVRGNVPASSDGLPTWLWIVVAALVVLAVLLAWWLIARRQQEEYFEEEYEDGPPSADLPLPDEPDFELDDSAPIDVAAPVRREIDSDAELTTQVNVGDPRALRRRYIEERFPEIVNGTILLDDPDSVVKAARLFYEQGVIPRAIELLQFVTEESPAQAKPWLALFEIYRLERQTEEFANLAVRFKEPHGKSENWRKVQFFGREIDPANALYRDVTAGIETIKFEAGKPPAPSSYDPIAENWLAAPMDFENEVLANELRRGLLNGAGLSDQDLLPNPMPALRRVEMFTVA
ncbi:type IV pilus assembly protein FimV [Usitatibacter palustris]|uniref:LysM domain-containing protein n=1 Tax=Usitatibacter palustris TaxID=2732487 RepID=A0A6M4H7Z3_9PROT|nr:hypothetical protein [Usitatibacter palustris]QJR14494.1 hypothetical protein DSM104440_01295 [Usitatibacter palustris]